MTTGLVLICFALAVVSTLLIETLTARSQFFNEMEGKTLTELQFVPKPIPPSPAITRIVITEADGKALSPNNSSGALPRPVIAKLILSLAKSNASVVLSDILFVDEKPGEDPEFLSQIQSALDLKNTALIFPADTVESWENPKEWDDFTDVFHVMPGLRELDGNITISMTLGLAPVQNLIGCLPFKDDGYTGVRHYHSAILAAWKHQRLDPKNTQLANRTLNLDSWEAKLGYNHELPLIWTPKREDFPSISFSEAITELNQGNDKPFQDKIIIISDGRNRDDIAIIPKHGEVPGSLAVANLINVALSPPSQRVSWFDYTIQFNAIVVGAFMTGLLFLSRNKLLFLFGICAPFVFGLLIPYLLATTQRIIFPTIWPLMACLIPATIGAAYSLLRPKDQIYSPGQLTEATILFSDLTSSTEWVQKIGAVEYQSRFTKWLDICEAILIIHEGHIERTTGDGFIAVFPNPPVKSSPSALKSCQEILKQMEDNHSEFDVSFGFESGPVSGGFLTESGRKVWSSSGTTVNMAKRLQSEAGKLDSQIIFGPIAARILAETTTIQSLGRHKLKGIEGEIECFTSSHP